MIKEIVPFPEPFVAPFVVTLQDLDIALGAGIFVGKDSIQLRIWDVLLDLHRSQVKGLPCLNCHHDITTHLIKCLTGLLESLSLHFVLSILQGRA